MLSNPTNPLFQEFLSIIDDESVRAAFHVLIGAAAVLPEFACGPEQKGAVRDFRFYTDDDEQPFAFIINKKSLLFYFRKPAVKSGRWMLPKLRNVFTEVKENNAGEWTIKIYNPVEAIALVELLFGREKLEEHSLPSGGDVGKLIEFIQDSLDLGKVIIADEYYYNSLTLCVIDAVYASNARYESVKNVVGRYCDYFEIKKFRDPKIPLPTREDQESISDLCARYTELGVYTFTESIFQNRQLTSTKGGIRKAEAVLRFSSVLKLHSIEYLQDIPAAMKNEDLQREIKRIPGQSSGISLTYFWMLAGSDDHTKPDRMVIRFMTRILNRVPSLDEAQSLLRQAAVLLRPVYKGLTPRILDYAIWLYERKLR